MFDPLLPYRQLLLGVGHTPKRTLIPPHHTSMPDNFVTLDNNPDCNPHIVFDLNRLQLGHTLPDPSTHRTECPSNFYDEIHAYEVLEHIGQQGHFTGFFLEFAEYWRVLKPHGYLCGSVPNHDSVWAWGDPGHTRVITDGTFVFLSKEEYRKQLGRTSMSDYRSLLGDVDFSIVHISRRGECMHFILQAIKPHT